MHVLFLPMIPTLTASSAGCEKARPGRTAVASVSGEYIFLDQLSPCRDVGRDRRKPSASEILKLARLIRTKVIRQEVRERRITVPSAMVEEESRALAEGQWKIMGKSGEERQRVLKKTRDMNQKIRQGILLWKEDEAAGNRFAQEKLAPMGIDKSIWKYCTSRANDPQFLEWLERACSYDREQLRREWVPAARRALETKELQRSVVGDPPVTETEVYRLFTLTQRTEELELMMVQVQRVLQGKEKLETEDLASSTTVRLSGSDLGMSAANPYRRVLVQAAVHCESLNPGSCSKVFPTRNHDRWRHVLLRVLARVPKAGDIHLQQETRARLGKAIVEFKRSHAFEIWVSKKALQRTTILDKRFEEVRELLSAAGESGGHRPE